MLILERRTNQKIHLTGGIVITICSIDRLRKKVKLGFEAPQDINIIREEVLFRDKKNADQPTI